MRVLLLTIDAWRPTHASFHPDAERRVTPELASLAEEGIVFARAYSHGPATPYAFPGLMTSTYPLDHGGYEHLSEERTLLSEALADAGWRCVGAHSNPWLGEKYGYARGYEEYRDVGEFDLPLLEWGREALLERFGLDHPVYRTAQSVYRRLQGPLRALGGGRADEVRVAREALADATDDTDDLFVWTHLLAPHAPYAPPRRHREAVGVGDVDATELVTRAQRDPDGLSADEREAVADLYAASIRHVDEQAGAIIERADDDTLVVVTADHGEALFEHATVGHPPRLWDELVHVPLIVRPPGGTAPRVVEEPVRHVDVAPTVLDYAGVTPPPSYRGRSLRSAIEDGDGGGIEDGIGGGIETGIGGGREAGVDRDGARASEVERGDRSPEPVVMEVASTEAKPGTLDPEALRVGVRSADRKLVFASGEHRGYDLSTDPDERDPVVEPTGERWSRLRQALQERRNEMALEEGAVAFDASTEERLRDLGYLE